MAEYAVRLQNGTDTATRMRMADTLGLAAAGPLTGRSGLRPDGGGAVTVVAGSMAVTVAPFHAWIDGTSSTAQAGYPFVLDAAKTLTVTAGHATLARVDTVVAEVLDTAYDGSGSTLAQVRLVEGTPGAGAPAVPANAVPLRDVNVPAGASAGTGGLTAGNLGADRRTYTAALGGVVRVGSVAERDALGGYVDVVKRLDTGLLECYDGTNWHTVRPNPPAGRVLRSATQSLANSTTTDLSWDTTVYVAGGMTAGATGLTVPVSGLYVVHASVAVDNSGTSGFFHLALTIGGVPVQTLERSPFATNAPSVSGGSSDVRLTAGQVASLSVFHNNGSARTIFGGDNYETALSLRWVAP